MTNENKDIRGSLLGKKKNFSETEFEIEGEKVFIRKPSIKERNEIQQMSVKGEGDSIRFDGVAFRIHAIISCVVDPASKQPIFERSDFEELQKYPTGSWVDKLSEKLEEILYVNVEETKKD